MTTNDPLDPMIPAQPQPSKARKEQAPRAQGSPASGERRGEWKFGQEPKLVPESRPRGQQQEWFYHAEGSNRFHVYFGSVVVGGVIVGTERQAKAICDAHNAAIAAVKLERDSFEESCANYGHRLCVADEELAAERQRREQADKLYHALLVVSELQAKELGKVSEQLQECQRKLGEHNG